MHPVLFILFVLVFSYFIVPSKRTIPLPPGPRRLPIVGNVFNRPKERFWLQYAQWAAQFGEIIYLELFGSPIIVLNSLTATSEIFEKRSAIYSDRPRMVMVNELMGWAWDLAHMPYSDTWRRHRKMFHQHFQPRAVPAYHQVQLDATNTLLRQLLESPNDFVQHVRRHAGESILRVVYGYRVKSDYDHYIKLAEEAVRGISAALVSGAFLVDYLPFLRHIPTWMPGASFKRKATVWATSSANLRDTPFEMLKRSMEAGDILNPSFTLHNLEKIRVRNGQEPTVEEEEVVKNCAGIAYLAGSDTTVSVVLSFMLAMTLHPDVQKRAQAELDRIVGSYRLPDFQDRPSLPYVDAILSETLRWNPVTPLAVPHRALKDDVYNGMLIPAGSTVVGNAWAILHDEQLYPDPFAFKPERFIGGKGSKAPDPAAIGAFGFGRRLCPGRYFGVNSAWIAIASILWAFDISKPLENGHEVEPAVRYTDGLVTHPEPFNLRLSPRSEATKALLLRT